MDQPNSEPDCSVTDDGPALVARHLGYPTDNIPHTILPDELMPAKQLAPGVTLITRDGAIIGNAIVVKSTRTALARNNNELEPVWLVETDFGNRLRPTTSEIFAMWDLGYVQDYDRWWDSRLELIKRSVEP